MGSGLSPRSCAANALASRMVQSVVMIHRASAGCTGFEGFVPLALARGRRWQLWGQMIRQGVVVACAEAEMMSAGRLFKARGVAAHTTGAVFSSGTTATVGTLPFFAAGAKLTARPAIWGSPILKPSWA